VDLRELLSIVWKRRLVVLLVVVLSVGAGVAFGKSRQATYESTVTVAITPDIQKTGFVAPDNLSALLGTYAQTAESDVVRASAERILGHPLTGTVSGSTQAGTGILHISARANTPAEAKETAEAVSRAFLQRIKSDNSITADILNPAGTPTAPVQPRMPLIVGASLVLGFGIAILFALALDRFRARVETPADIAELTTLPVLAQITRNRGLLRSRPQVVWDEASWVEIQEGFRTLRTNLQFMTGDSGQAIQVTSPSASQGKSTIVANLGVAFAQVGVSTVIVDADLRRPAQHQIFQLDNRSTVWGDRSGSLGAMENWAKSTRHPGLFVVPAGEGLGDPSELLNVRFARLVGELKAAYDLVLVDTPPLLPVSDGIITAASVDSVVLVVSAGNERPTNLRHAIQALELTDARIAGFVLNQTTAPKWGGYDVYHRPGVPVSSLPESEQPPSERDRPRTPRRERAGAQ
jgi:polysaccharide biosynthesis transport protein